MGDRPTALPRVVQRPNALPTASSPGAARLTAPVDPASLLRPPNNASSGISTDASQSVPRSLAMLAGSSSGSSQHQQRDGSPLATLPPTTSRYQDGRDQTPAGTILSGDSLQMAERVLALEETVTLLQQQLKEMLTSTEEFAMRTQRSLEVLRNAQLDEMEFREAKKGLGEVQSASALFWRLGYHDDKLNFGLRESIGTMSPIFANKAEDVKKKARTPGTKGPNVVDKVGIDTNLDTQTLLAMSELDRRRRRLESIAALRGLSTASTGSSSIASASTPTSIRLGTSANISVARTLRSSRGAKRRRNSGIGQIGPDDNYEEILGSDEDDEDDEDGFGDGSRTRGKLSKNATETLRTWLFNHSQRPYPTEEEKRVLSSHTSLTMVQINNWFSNARRRILRKGVDNSKKTKKAKRAKAAVETVNLADAFLAE